MDAREVERAAVIGAGTMGHSIALSFAMSGIVVDLVDVEGAALDAARERMRHALATLARGGVIAGDRADEVLAFVRTSTETARCAAGADFVVETVPEVPEVKREVFAQLEAACPQDVVIASNTSGLDIFSIAEMSHPGRLLIAHWFNPAHIIPLVEVVPGPSTAPEAVSFTASLLERLGKVPVVMKGFTRAFIVNKIQNMMSLAVFELLGSGLATPEDVDLAVKYSLGIRLPVVGVVQTLDFTGLDLVADLLRSYGLSNPLIEEKVAAGELGAKTSRGIYDYGGRSEAEILEKRDGLYLRVLAFLKEIGAFEPI